MIISSFVITTMQSLEKVTVLTNPLKKKGEQRWKDPL